MRVGLFVGGHSRRMGGMPKGLLAVTPSSHETSETRETIVERLVRITRGAGLEPVFVGGEHRAAPYLALDLGLPLILDARDDAGPLGGLVALLEATPGEDVLVLACDLPRLAESVLEKLARPQVSQTLSPFVGDLWQPLVARYAWTVRDLAARRLAEGELSLQRLLPLVQARKLDLDDEETSSLVDWDCAEDIGR